MGMLTDRELQNLQSPFSRFCVTVAGVSECHKRWKKLKKANRHNYSVLRLWKDRFNGMSFEESYRAQFKANGADYDQFGADAANTMLEVLFGEGGIRLTREEYASISSMITEGQTEEWVEIMVEKTKKALDTAVYA